MTTAAAAVWKRLELREKLSYPQGQVDKYWGVGAMGAMGGTMEEVLPCSGKEGQAEEVPWAAPRHVSPSVKHSGTRRDEEDSVEKRGEDGHST